MKNYFNYDLEFIRYDIHNAAKLMKTNHIWNWKQARSPLNCALIWPRNMLNASQRWPERFAMALFLHVADVSWHKQVIRQALAQADLIILTFRLNSHRNLTNAVHWHGPYSKSR